jgi:hypothetical protein
MAARRQPSAREREQAHVRLRARGSVLLGIRALLARRSPELGGLRAPIVASPS